MNTDPGGNASGDRSPGGTVVAAPAHRAVSAPPVSSGVSGAAARHANMWWVAWRLQRMQVAVLVVIAAAGAAALAILRWRIVATFRELGCELFPTDPNGQGCVDATGNQVWWNDGFSSWSSLAHAAMVAGPVVLGAFAAAPVFTREFARGTHVLALTQSVGRRRWFVAKTTVVVVPLVVALLALGVLMQWTDGAVGITAYGALDQINFLARGIMPAAVGLAAYGLTLAIGMLGRNLLAALVAGILVGGAMLAGVAAVQLHVLPADRTVTTMAEAYPVVTQAMIDAENAQNTETHVVVPIDRNQAYVGSGYLSAAGDKVTVPNSVIAACYNGGNKAGAAAAKAAGLSDGSDGSGSDGSVMVSGGEVTAHAINADSTDFYNSPQYRTAYNESVRTCFENAGVAAQYSDMMPGSMLWPLRWATTAICVILAALFVAVAAWRLPRAVAKR